jgi:serine protease Do
MKKIILTSLISLLVMSSGFCTDIKDEKNPMSTNVAHAETIANVSRNLAYNFVPLVKKVRPAVVKVISEAIVETGGSTFGGDFFRDDFFDRFFNFRTPRRRQKVSGVGSGFFVSQDGYILTNYHVVKDAIKIKILDINHKEYFAKKIGVDPRTDLALLKIKKENNTYIELGDSNKVQVGEWVLAIGNPLGQDLTVTSGIISAKGRELSGLEVDYQNFIQTDAPINQGNSGGPLINMEGKAIGINTVIISPSGGNVGIGFAIPSHMAKKVIADLKTKGKVTRGYLGILISDISESDAEDYDLPGGGVLIAKVDPDTPAQKAGLKRYDLIVEANGQEIKTATELKRIIANSSPGDVIELKVYRLKKEMVINVKVEEAPDTEKIRTDDKVAATIDLGMILKNNSSAFARKYQLKTSKGIVVTEVSRGGIANQNGIKEGDVILAVNRREIENIDDFREIISEKKPGAKFLLFIDRYGSELIIRFKIPE